MPSTCRKRTPVVLLREDSVLSHKHGRRPSTTAEIARNQWLGRRHMAAMAATYYMYLILMYMSVAPAVGVSYPSRGPLWITLSTANVTTGGTACAPAFGASPRQCHAVEMVQNNGESPSQTSAPTSVAFEPITMLTRAPLFRCRSQAPLLTTTRPRSKSCRVRARMNRSRGFSHACADSLRGRPQIF